MSRRRKISTLISTDKAVNALAREGGVFAALLYTWMIPHAEDDASITGDPDELLLMVVPGLRDYGPDDVAQALDCMATKGLIAWDKQGPTVYFDSEGFYRHQSYIPEGKRVDNSAHFSKTPAKPGSAKQRGTAQKAASLSLSPSPSPSRSKTLAGSDEPTALELLSGEVVEPNNGFDAFYDLWPRHDKRLPAERAWGRLTKAKRKKAMLGAEVVRRLYTAGQAEKQFIPMPATYLNQERWTDFEDGEVPMQYLRGESPGQRREREQRDIIERVAARYGNDAEEHP